MNVGKWLALGFGSLLGVGIRRSLMLLFGRSGSSLSVSTVTTSSMLGGFAGLAIGYIVSTPNLSSRVQTLFMFGLLGVMATVAADATAAQATLNSQDAIRVRKRFGVHFAIGAGAALIGIGVITWIMAAFS